MTSSPYKFLDYYSVEDHDIFFGRERETRVLLSDIVVNRLVVLFAKTGTGKTSLINAGVRPRLHDRDYETFYIRVEKDPSESARALLSEMNLLLKAPEQAPLAVQLEAVVARLGKPVVLFFDQFEEFFIQIRSSQIRRQFIEDVAQLYHNRNSGVHIVFSMREEYFHEMDEFRDAIPSIFQKNSNLRLRPFDAEQAREAIAMPAKMAGAGVTIDDLLVKQLIDDLVEEERIAPSRLQIVCYTLWERTRPCLTIGLEDYQRLGEGSPNPAEWIIYRRLEQDVERALDPGQMSLFERLLPLLRTEEGTKYPRELGDLVRTLGADQRALEDLIFRLKGINLLREGTLHGASSVEWVSDYVAGRADDLRRSVKTISVRCQVREAMRIAHQWESTGAEPDSEVEARFMAPDTYESLSSQVADILGELREPAKQWVTEHNKSIFTLAEVEFMFEAALQQGTYLQQWFHLAVDQGVEVWSILKAKIEDQSARIEQAESAVRLLGELASAVPWQEQAIGYLKVALRQEALASLAISTLAETRTTAAVSVLEEALNEAGLALQAIAALFKVKTETAVKLLERTVQQDGPFALQAGLALRQVASGRPSAVTAVAAAALDGVLHESAGRLFERSLEQGFEMRFWFEKACERGVDVWAVVRNRVTDPDVPLEQAENAVQLLGDLGSSEALELLGLALQQDQLAAATVAVLGRLGTQEAIDLLRSALQQENVAPQAGMALYRIARGQPSRASAQASGALGSILVDLAEPLFVQALDQGLDMSFWFERAVENGIDVWKILEERVIGSEVPVQQTKNAIRLLGDLGSVQAIALLEMALKQDITASLAQEALNRIAASTTVDPEARGRAEELLTAAQIRADESVKKQPAAQTLAPVQPRITRGWEVDKWSYLVRAIEQGTCMPIVGAGVLFSAAKTDLHAVFAQQLAAEFGYPLPDTHNLAAVAEYVATVMDPAFVKRRTAEFYARAFKQLDMTTAYLETCRMLADLPLPIYITTSYDDSLEQALQSSGKMPRAVLLNLKSDFAPPSSTEDSIRPSVEKPFVFYLYGRVAEPESLVLTVDDYLDFMVAVARDSQLVSPVLMRALTTSSLLLLGYTWNSLDLRILQRGLIGSVPRFIGRRSFAAVLAPADSEVRLEPYLNYVQAQANLLDLQLFWGTTQELLQELMKRWQANS